jgi:hypothetical protein
VQLTAGTRFSSRNECERYARLVSVIDEQVGLEHIPSELYCYMTAPKEPSLVDAVFEAGADRSLTTCMSGTANFKLGTLQDMHGT